MSAKNKYKLLFSCFGLCAVSLFIIFYIRPQYANGNKSKKLPIRPTFATQTKIFNNPEPIHWVNNGKTIVRSYVQYYYDLDKLSSNDLVLYIKMNVTYSEAIDSAGVRFWIPRSVEAENAIGQGISVPLISVNFQNSFNVDSKVEVSFDVDGSKTKASSNSGGFVDFEIKSHNLDNVNGTKFLRTSMAKEEGLNTIEIDDGFGNASWEMYAIGESNAI